MSNADVIEVDGTTAGIVVADERGFRFYSAVHRFRRLDGLIFRHRRDAERAARKLIPRTAGFAIGRREPLRGLNAAEPGGSPRPRI